jgi:hypothetical protein
VTLSGTIVAGGGTGGFPAGSVDALLCIVGLFLLMLVAAVVGHVRYRTKGGLSPMQQRIMGFMSRHQR